MSSVVDSRALLGVWLLCCGLVCGCGEERVERPELHTYCDVFECTSSCAALTTGTCQVEDSDCQARVQKSVGCVRNIKFKRSVEASVPVA